MVCRPTVRSGPTGASPADALFSTGPAAFLNVAADTEAQLAWLQRTDPDYLISYPSHLAAPAEEFCKRDLRLPRLREVCAVGETVTEQQRVLCREAWDVSLTDMYSCEEVGCLALQCPETGEYHMQTENVLLEILDEQNRPCKEGEVGRVVVTGCTTSRHPCCATSWVTSLKSVRLAAAAAALR